MLSNSLLTLIRIAITLFEREPELDFGGASIRSSLSDVVAPSAKDWVIYRRIGREGLTIE